MTTELAIQTTTLAEAQEYSISLSKSDLLPVAYRGKPANVLLAVESGKALGIPAIQAINQIHIINGTPALSANLMRALVQRAGHVIRVTGDNQSATAILIRKDDPQFEHTSTWNIARAKVAGLTGGNWAKHPDAMLKARATAEVCRNGAADVLMGFDYIEDEVRSFSTPVTVTNTKPGDRLRAAAGLPVEEEIHDAELVDTNEPLITEGQRIAMQTMFGQMGWGKDDRDIKLGFVADVLGFPVASSKDLSVTQASAVLDALDARLAAQEATDA